MANNEFTATKIVLKTEKDGVKKYCIPYVPNATSTETGLIKPDGTTTEVTDGVLSVKSGVIPAEVTEAIVTGWGFTKNAGTVTKVNNVAPVNGNVTISIPAAVTTDTVAGWGYTKNAGTITGIKMNGASKGTSGVVDLGTVITSTTDCVKTSGNQTIAGTKTFSATIAGSINGNAATATKATSDGSGNNIVSTYSTKTELENALTTLTTQLTEAAK